MRQNQPLISSFFSSVEAKSTSDTKAVSRKACDNSITLYYQNVRGLRTKTADFSRNVLSCDCDIIALTETSLCSSIYDGELFKCSQFSVYRHDRSALNSTHERFGGVLIAVRSSIRSEIVEVPGTENVELLVVRVKCQTGFIYVCCLYIPSGSSVDVYNNYVLALERVFDFVDLEPSDEICVLGDFNLKGIEWVPGSIGSVNDWARDSGALDSCTFYLPGEVDEGSKAEIVYLLLSNGLNQVNGIRNFQNNILDLVFFSNADNIESCKSDMPLSRKDVYHDPIELVIATSFLETIEPRQVHSEFNFKRGDFVGLDAYLSSVSESNFTTSGSDVNDMVDSFYEVLLVGLNKFIPLKRVFQTSGPPWYNQRIKNLKNRRSKAYKRYRASIGTIDEAKCKIEFYAIRNEFENMQRVAYDRYIEKTQELLKADPSKFWKYVNSTKNTTGYPSMMYRGNDRCHTPNGISNLFADFFESVYVSDVDDGALTQCPSVNGRADLGEISLCIDDVLLHLKGVDTSKGDGPDNISPLLLKNCASSLAVPLLAIFNRSLSTGKFPTRWKSSYITPIFKSGARGNIENYRGVAILPTFGKLFEAIVCGVLSDRLRSVISRSQHGFMKGRSISTNLIDFVSNAIKVMESGAQLDVIYTDFKKAFDRVRHSILIRKLNELGIHSSLLGWIESYLTGRSQYVKISGWSSRVFEVTSGVPQGSHLGPLLFILFINDVTKNLSASMSYFMYADDLKICRVIRSVRDSIEMQRDLNGLVQWCRSNKLFLNSEKCYVMSFTRKLSKIEFDYMINDVNLKRPQVIRDLGVLLDAKLTFSKHIAHIIAKAYSMLGFVMRICKDFKNIQALKSVYFAHVRSYLEYASVVWHPYMVTYIDKIESIQKKFLIYALRRSVSRDENYRLPSYISRCDSIILETLVRRRINACVFFVFDLLRGRLDAPGILSHVKLNRDVVSDRPVRHSRESRFLVIHRHRTDYGQHEPINDLCMNFNRFSHLYSSVISRDAFRCKVQTMKVTIKLNGKDIIT